MTHTSSFQERAVDVLYQSVPRKINCANCCQLKMVEALLSLVVLEQKFWLASALVSGMLGEHVGVSRKKNPIKHFYSAGMNRYASKLL